MRNGVSSRWVAALAVVTSSCGLSALRLERVQRRQPLGRHAQRRRGAVVGQAVPAGKGQHLELGREQRPASASARIAASSATIATARPPLPDPCAARARSAASHGQEARRDAGQGQRLSARRTRCSGSLIARSGCNRASAAPPSSVPRSAPATARFRRPGHDVDVLLLEHRLEQRALVLDPSRVVRIEEPADQQIGFLGAAMMRAPGEALQLRCRKACARM